MRATSASWCIAVREGRAKLAPAASASGARGGGEAVGGGGRVATAQSDVDGASSRVVGRSLQAGRPPPYKTPDDGRSTGGKPKYLEIPRNNISKHLDTVPSF
eukprot:SAG31_NODE_18721_length_625_cov_1.041825_1_plen_101_part_10